MAKSQTKNEDIVKTEDTLVAPKITYDITEINKVVNYLGSRPYHEVHELIRVMRSGTSS